MTRIEPLSGARAPLLLRLFNIVVRKLYGREALPFNIMAHNPGFLVPFALMSAFAAGKTRLDPRVRALAMHRVSELNGCSWCLDYGASVLLKLGVPAQKVNAVEQYRTSPLFDDRERAALTFAEAVTSLGVPVSDEQFADLKRYFDDREIVELLSAICAENFYNRFNAALGIESQGFCEIPTLARRAA